ncbi:Bromodomain [Dillenia turbinata]|uniref:Bromodomain n=1 Tax=Dillenia turbinata TaxID=194707 RepID=A0AAN8ZJ79_9MAGN
MPRKVQKTKWRNEVRRRRRSPRLSALSVSLPNRNANASPHSDLEVILEEEEEDESEAEQRQQKEEQEEEAQDDETASDPDSDSDSRPYVRGQRPRLPARTRARTSSSSKKRKFRPVKEGRTTNNENRPTKFDELPAAQPMPEKRILELVLDVLQRRDAYEIFGEPVDPEEVQDYYEIIKEPMDFGTMRAKLHEGMYSNFPEFEHDIFLITRNAMLFNSSGTIYFKQARTIDELAKKVFHTLKTDPESFERENVASRRRSCRRIHSESEISNYGACPKFASNAKVTITSVTASFKATSNSISEATRRRNPRANPGCSGSGIHIAAGDGEIKSGPRRSSMSKQDLRHTYRPWMSFSMEQNSIVSAVYRNMVPVIRVDQQDISYTKSLLSFVKDLGPTAQKIAKHKLQQCWTPKFHNPGPSHHMQGSTTQIPSASASMHQKSSPPDAVLPSQETRNFFNHHFRRQDFAGKLVEKKNYSSSGDKESADINDRSNMFIPSREQAVSLEDGKSSQVVGLKRELHLTEGVNIFGAFSREMVGQNKNSEIQLGADSFHDKARDLNLSAVAAREIAKKSTKIPELAGQLQTSELARDYSQSNMLDSMIKSKRSPLCSWLVQAKEMSILDQDKGLVEIVSLDNDSGTSLVTSAPGSRTGLGHQDADEVGKERQCIQSTASPFIFDLPFLKSRLSQMNNQGDHRPLQLGLCADKSLHGNPCINGVCIPFTLPPPLHADKPCTLPVQNCQQRTPLDGMDAKHADLALKL